MKRLGLTIAAFSVLAALLPAASSAVTIDTFVGCDETAEEPVPATVCTVGDSPAAYFESNGDIEYDVCVEFPDLEFLCREDQFAEADTLYLNAIATELTGVHHVYWYLGDDPEELPTTEWSFQMEPAPAPVLPPPAPFVPTTVSPLESTACKKAKARVSNLKRRLRNAGSRGQKAKLRGKLRKARATAKAACS